jgi:ABC-type transport system involved in multi-copper enzyme maturation permease subunit
MLRLIRADLYRLLHKKSLFLYFGGLAICYIAIAYIRSGGFDQQTVASDALTLFTLSPALIGGFLFTAVYTDDLNAKALITLVGSGLGKNRILLAKTILMATLGLLAFALLPVFHVAVYALLGIVANASQLAILYAAALNYLLLTLAYATFSSIVVYGLQRPVFAVLTYFLLAFGVVQILLVAIINVLDLAVYEHLLPGITSRIMTSLLIGSPPLWPVAEYAGYLVVALAICAVAFHKKEMEF